MFVSLRIKIFLAMVTVAAVVALATAAVTYFQKREALLGDFQVFVRAAAGTAALGVAVEDLALIGANADAERPIFQFLKKHLEDVRRVNRLAEDEVYILRPVAPDSAEVEFVVMTHAQPFVGNRYTIRPENLDTFRRAFALREVQATGIYSDQHGDWISAYAPVLDRQGNVGAILEVDARLGRFLAQLNAEMMAFALAALGACALAVVPGLLLAARLTSDLSKLSTGLVRFKGGDATVEVFVRSGDELETLADSFNEMISVWREKAALLPFVSKFTADAIHRSRGREAVMDGHQQDVFVLFADLRGFTRFSQQRAAADLIRQLNRLLAVKAETVLQAGGDVDKFMGDAIMAVFTAGPCKAEQAVRCAADLIRNVQEEIARQGWDLSVGVGLHCGPAVLGAVGSEVRRDYTAIGHTVNIASRLCARAAPGELLVSREIHAQLPPETAARFTGPTEITVKNVSGPLPVYALAAGA